MPSFHASSLEHEHWDPETEDLREELSRAEHVFRLRQEISFSKVMAAAAC